MDDDSDDVDIVVEKRPHPPGEAGVYSSLEAVANKIAKGRLSWRVRLWAIECLDRARKERGWKMNTEKERATVLLEACQQKLWVPDPVGSEFIAGAHLMACDPAQDAVCFRGGDCDDIVVMLGSALGSVGIHTMVVGHGYKKNIIQHVIVAARVNGRWEYADPSTDLPLGHCVKFSRERIYSTPNVMMLCDDDKCLVDKRAWEPEESGFVTKGDFVGLSGVQVGFAWIR